jgi:hypothetical protein
MLDLGVGVRNSIIEYHTYSSFPELKHELFATECRLLISIVGAEQRVHSPVVSPLRQAFEEFCKFGLSKHIYDNTIFKDYTRDYINAINWVIIRKYKI